MVECNYNIRKDRDMSQEQLEFDFVNDVNVVSQDGKFNDMDEAQLTRLLNECNTLKENVVEFANTLSLLDLGAKDVRLVTWYLHSVVPMVKTFNEQLSWMLKYLNKEQS